MNENEIGSTEHAEVRLANGARLRTRPVPPHVYIVFKARLNAGLPPAPEPPMVDVQMKAGHTERIPAGKDDPRYAEYRARRDEWEALQQKSLESADSEWNTLIRDYAVVAWSWDEGVSWESDAPEDWQYPAALERAGLSASQNRRVDYVSLELLTTNTDFVKLMDAVEGRTSAGSIGTAADVTEAEVTAATAGFRRGRRGIARPTGDRDHSHDVSRGNGGGEGVGKRPGLLVRLLTRGKGDDGSARTG